MTNFIPVLVDRDERPDVDQIYQAAAMPRGLMPAAGRSPCSS